VAKQVELTALEELQEVAEALREADETEKAAKAVKEQVRPAFLDLISEVVRDTVPLARQVLTVLDTDLDRFGYDYDKWCEYNYPEWRIVAVEVGEPNVSTKIAIEEDDALKKYEFEHDGYKYGRTFKLTGRRFDAEAYLQEVNDTIEDEDLFEALEKTVKKVVTTTYEFDEAKATKVMADYPETVTLFQKYLFPGKPSSTLLPIRPVKEREE
jgi:hypothetical protein